MDGHGGCARRGKQAAATAWASSASLTLALGCGPSLSDGDSGDSGADTGAPAVEDGESGPMLGEDCAAYLDTMEVGEPRTLVVRNSTSAPVYLAGAAGCSQQRFAIVGDDGTAPASLCDCEYVMTDESCGVCSSCLDTALRIEPGAEYSETWDGAVYVQGAIPEACVPDPTCAQNCAARRAAGAATYEVSLRGTAMPTACVDDSAPCECDAGIDGYCLVELDAFGELAASRRFEHPGSGIVELVLE